MVKRSVNGRRMFFCVAVGRDRPIQDVTPRRRTRTWITWILVNRSKPDPFVTKNDLFGAIAMVSVEIPDPEAFATGCQRVMGSDRDRVQITKAHCLGRGCMMARGTHQ